MLEVQYKTYMPLFTIIVITYNSSKYVLETLESAKAQTYQNIELIISDDCSSDSTIEICKKWTEDNKSRFVRVDLLTSNKNTGIAANCNRGVRYANGKYIKLIAGDDLIEKNTVEIIINYFNKNENALFVCGNVTLINSSGQTISMLQKPNNFIVTFEKQFQSNQIYTPSIAFKKEVFYNVNGFSEEYKIEDIDFFLKVLYANIKIHYIPENLACYRIHSSNISSDNMLMLKEHKKILMRYKNCWKYYKYNYLIFSKNILFSTRKSVISYSFLDAFKVLKENHLFIWVLFFDVDFIFKYLIILPLKSIYHKIMYFLNLSKN